MQSHMKFLPTSFQLVYELGFRPINSESSFLNPQIEDSAVQLVRQEVTHKKATNKTCRTQMEQIVVKNMFGNY